jgi:hypothetical protein
MSIKKRSLKSEVLLPNNCASPSHVLWSAAAAVACSMALFWPIGKSRVGNIAAVQKKALDYHLINVQLRNRCQVTQCMLLFFSRRARGLRHHDPGAPAGRPPRKENPRIPRLRHRGPLPGHHQHGRAGNERQRVQAEAGQARRREGGPSRSQARVRRQRMPRQRPRLTT